MTFSEPPRKKRKLPSLDSLFEAPPRATDSPELHQGRLRTVPHERGQWASHIYLELSPSPAFRKSISRAVDQAISASPEFTVHSLLQPASISTSRLPTPTATQETSSILSEPSQDALHLSLSRPLILQSNQRADLRAGVAKAAKELKGFSARYATFGILENDEKTRRFLGIEIGAGYDDMRSLLRHIDAMLTSLRLPTYYPEPRFHTSLAWTSTTSACPVRVVDLPFPDDLLSALDEQLGKKLRAEQLWVGELCVKIGKEVTRFPLSSCELKCPPLAATVTHVLSEQEPYADRT
ncbi:hypothetical protein JCM11251_001982 [Rhodosporidiobolus azoricus]